MNAWGEIRERCQRREYTYAMHVAAEFLPQPERGQAFSYIENCIRGYEASPVKDVGWSCEEGVYRFLGHEVTRVRPLRFEVPAPHPILSPARYGPMVTVHTLEVVLPLIDGREDMSCEFVDIQAGRAVMRQFLERGIDDEG